MAKWATINNSFNSTADTFGGKWGNDISRYLNGIDVGAIDNEKEPVIRTNTRFGFGRLKFYDSDESHTAEFQMDNVVSGANRIFRLRSLTSGTTDYLVTEAEGAVLQNKTLTTATLGSTLAAAGNSITRIGSVGLQDIDASNVNLVSITGSTSNSTFGFLSSYGGIFGATSITVTHGNASKIHKYEWYSTVPGVNTKLFDIQSTKVTSYVPLDLNGNAISNATITLSANSITDNMVAAHTSTKITITNKSQLNSNIVYNDQANTFTTGDQIIPSGNFKLSNSGFTTTFTVGTLTANRTITLPNTTTTLVDTSDSRLSDSRSPTSHATSHKSGGSDLIKINELAAPTTNISGTNSTTSANGTLRVLSGVATEYLDGSGAWSVPPVTSIGSVGAAKANVTSKSGNGTTKIFTIAHGLGTTPAVAVVKPTSINAFGDFTTSFDATNITITYQNAPPSGTNNLEYNWIVMDPLASSGGEINTYSSVGTGVVVTKTKTGVDFPFRSFIAGSTKLTITQNTNDLTFDINEANFTTFAGITHATRHKSGGADPIKVNELAASTTNNTATNSTTTVNGTLPVLSGSATQYLSGTGTWSTPAGTGGGEANTYSTSGTGLAWTQTKSGVNLPFKSFIAGSNKVTLTSNTNDITINIADANLSIAYGQLTSVPTTIVKTDQGNTFGSFTQIFPSSMLKLMNSAGTFGTIIANSAITTDRTLTLPLLTGNDTVVVLNLAQTLTNKTLTAPTITSIVSGTGTLTLPTNTTDTIMARTTTDTVTNKTMVLASNTITDTSAVAGDVPVHDGTRFLRKGKGADGTFLGVSGGTVGYYTPASGGGGTLPDGTPIPSTGRWGYIWGGISAGRGLFHMNNAGTFSYEIVSATEASTTMTTDGTDDSIAEMRTTAVWSRQSSIVFRAKWALKQTTNTTVMIGLSSASTLPVGSGHDTPLDNSSGVLITTSLDIESVYQISRNDGDATTDKTPTSVASNNTTAHTCEIALSTATGATVTIDGGIPANFTTEIPANTTPLYIYVHIEEIGSSTKAIQVYRIQATQL